MTWFNLKCQTLCESISSTLVKLGRLIPPKYREEVAAEELRDPTFITVIRVICRSIRKFFVERPGQIILSAIVLILLWGTHGEFGLFRYIWCGYDEPGKSLIPGIPWDHELISFVGGAVLLVGIPIVLIKCCYRQPLSAYGLAWPPKPKRKLAVQTFAFLLVVGLPFFLYGACFHDEVRELYPLYDGITNVGTFVSYELAYLLFFIAIEFIFRGYLLFGLAGVRDEEVGTDDEDNASSAPNEQGESREVGAPGVFYFEKYAVLIQMLSYTAWHLGKPDPEVMGTLFWGLAAGATAYSIRSIWPIILAHWLLNVALDALILLTT